MSFLKNPWLIAGGALDLIGLGLVIWSLPEGGWPLAAGVGCLLAGAIAISQANLGAVEPSPAGRRAQSHRIESELAGGGPRAVELKVRPKLVAGLWAIALGLMGLFFYERVWMRLPAVPSQSFLAEQGVELHWQPPASSTTRVLTPRSGQPRFFQY